SFEDKCVPKLATGRVRPSADGSLGTRASDLRLEEASVAARFQGRLCHRTLSLRQCLLAHERQLITVRVNELGQPRFRIGRTINYVWCSLEAYPLFAQRFINRSNVLDLKVNR